MRNFRILFMVMGLSITCVLNAQETHNNQDENKQSEGIKIGSRNYSRTTLGLFAPVDVSLGIAYDYETLRFSYDDAFDKPLHGGRLNYGFSFPLSKKGILSLDNNCSIRYNYSEDSKIGNGYKSLIRSDFGFQVRFLLSTGYCFSEKCYLTLGGGVGFEYLDEVNTFRTESGTKIFQSSMSFEKEEELMKKYDICICFSTSFRYKMLGLRVNYDIGTINHYNKRYYRNTNAPKSNTKKCNHFSAGIYYYFK